MINFNKNLSYIFLRITYKKKVILFIYIFREFYKTYNIQNFNLKTI